MEDKPFIGNEAFLRHLAKKIKCKHQVCVMSCHVDSSCLPNAATSWREESILSNNIPMLHIRVVSYYVYQCNKL